MTAILMGPLFPVVAMALYLAIGIPIALLVLYALTPAEDKDGMESHR